MAPRRSYDRDLRRDGARRGYDADHRRASRYGGEYRHGGPFGPSLGRYGTPFPGAAGYPAARFGWGPIGWASWGPGMEFWPYADVPGYGYGGEMRTPRRRPEESPSYGRDADREVRRWARRYGYDEGYEIRPRDRR